MAGARCTACGQANPDGAKFCNECAAPLAHAAGHEVRKTLTVLFADLVGFTSLAERLDQESLRRVMDCFYEEMRGAVHAHGGTVAKFIGDAVMAVWGTPVVREDDALRAVRAAEEMRGALAALNLDLDHRWGVRVGMRTGVNTGEVVVDPTKPADLLVGDTLNVAARLEQAAVDGEILIGPETYRLVRDAAVLKPVAPLQVKGKAKRLAAYRLVDGLHAPPVREETLRAPLVGREAELDRLRRAFDAAIDAGETRLVTVVGSPGVGKSRLAREFAARLAGEARVLRGHCEPVSEGATFLPVVEMVAAAGGVDAVSEGDARVREAVGALLGSGAPVSAEETFWAVRRFLEGLAREGPVVVVFDDIHWGEPTFLDLIEHLVEWGRDGAVLVVALARPELRDTRPGLAEAGLALEPLAPDASRALVDGLLGAAELPPSLAARVLDTADGNPLFLGEMLRMLVDDGVLRREGGVWVVADSEAVSVPPTIHALLAVRLERLPSAERTVAERAAVIGPHFTRAAVADLTGEPLADAIDVHLDALVRKELIVAARGSPDDPSFRFGHALVRDAAYRPLLKEARAELHERFAAWLEARGDEADEIIGFHLERAYEYRRELGPLADVARAIGRRAGERLGAAGARALAREDLPAAANLLTRALEVLEEGDAVRSAVLLDLAETLLSAGDAARGEHVVEELALRADAVGDERLRAYATVLGGQLANLVGAGSVRETIAVLGEAASVLEAAGDAGGVAKAQHVIAAAHALLGEVAAAEAALDRALIGARAAGDARRVTAVLSGAPRAALWGPSPVVRASGRCLDVVRIVRMTPGNRHVETTALRCQAVLEAMRGRADAARTILREGRAVLEELGLTLELHELDTHAGIVELLAGDSTAAEERLRAARDGFTALGVDVGGAQASALLARAVLQEGREEEAIELTEFAERRGGEDLKTAIAWRGVRAEALVRRGEHDDARRLAREAVAMAEPTDALADKADALMALVEVLRACGDADEARHAATRARDLYATKEHEVGVARASAAIGGPAARAPRDVAGTLAVGDSRREQSLGRFFALVNDRRWDELRELYAPDLRVVDHRSAGADLAREELIDSMRETEKLVPDFRWELREVLATSETHMAAVIELRGNALSGGGPMLLPFGQVSEMRDGRIARLELFDPDEEAAILARFDELQVQATTGAFERVYGGWLRAVNDRDWDALPDLYTPDYRGIDHRSLGAADMDVDAVIGLARDAADFAPDARWTHTRIVAARDDAVAAVLEVTGHVRDSGGALAQAYGVVALVRDGRLCLNELFDPDDDEAMLACFEELTRAEAATAVERDGKASYLEAHDPDDEAALLARFEEMRMEQHEGSEAERALAAYVRTYNERDWDAMAPLFPVEMEHVDRRSLTTWGSMVTGPDVVRELRGSTEVTPDQKTRIEVIETDGDAFATCRQTWTGTFAGSPMEIAIGQVVVVHDGHFVRIENFDADDDDARQARFDELRVEGDPVKVAAGVDPHHPAVALTRVQARAYSDRRWDDFGRTLAPEFVACDRRAVGWGDHLDRDQLMEAAITGQNVAPDIVERAEIIAVADSVAARMLSFPGHAVDGGGLLDLRLGDVIVFEDGHLIREEILESDHDAVLARFEELRAERARTPAERVRAEWERRFEARDWRALRELYTNDYTHVDHRRPALWEIGGPDDVVDQLRAAVKRGVLTHSHIETIAVQGDVMAIRETLSLEARDARTEVVVGNVVVSRDGRVARNEIFEPDDEAAVLARFHELRAAQADVSVSPGVEAGHPMVVLWRELSAAVNARDWAAVGAFFAEEYELVDHRPIGWEPIRGREGVVRVLRSSFTGIEDARLSSEMLAVADGLWMRLTTFAGRAPHSGPFEYAHGTVSVVEEGLIVREEHFPFEHTDAMRTRFEQLRAERENLAVAGHRGGLYAEDAVVVDHRPSGAGPEPQRLRLLATRGERLALLGDEQTRVLVQADHDGRLWRRDLYAAEDDAAAREQLAVLGDVDALDREQTGAVVANDWERVRDGTQPDIVLEYHPTGDRFVGWRAVAAHWRSVSEAVEELSCSTDRDEPAASTVWARREIWRGREPVTGASFEAVLEVVLAVDDERRLAAAEVFLVGDPRRAGAVARLSAAPRPNKEHDDVAGTVALGGSPPEREGSALEREVREFVRAFNDRDWEALAETYTEDCEHFDRRSVSTWGHLHSRDDLVSEMRGAVEVTLDMRLWAEVVATDRESLALERQTWSGSHAGGRFEIVNMVLVRFRDGRACHVEELDGDDEAGALARFEELRAERAGT